MIPNSRCGGAPRGFRSLSLWLAVSLPFLAFADAAAQEPVTRPNYKLAKKFSSSFLRKFVYDTSVRPQWIGDSERFWYSFRTSEGRRYWLVDAVAKTKVALFDHELLAGLISEACETPVDEFSLELRGLSFDDAGEVMTFSAKGQKLEFTRSTGELVKKGKASSSSATRGRGTRGLRSGIRTRRGGFSFTRGRSTGTRSEAAKKAARAASQKRVLDEWKRRVKEYHAKAAAKKKDKVDEKKEQETRSRDPRRRMRSFRGSPFSPDLKLYVFAKGHNLYIAERKGPLPKPAEEKPDAKKNSAAAKKKAITVEPSETSSTRTRSRTRDEKKPAPLPFDESKATQLTKDGEEDYSFGGSDGYSVPARVAWAPDSSSFYVTRRDQRGVAELFLVDSLGQPRPTLRKYKYPMPGEDKVRRSELIVLAKNGKKLIPIKPKWKDESYSDVRWMPNGELRVLRRDRLRRNVEYGAVDPKTGDFKVLFKDGVKNANLNTQSIRYLDKRNEFIWWSERSGWGHYYLYGMDGKVKNAITRGRFRASRIVDVDEEKGILWFRANGREKNESIYHEHLYRVRLDGGGLTLLDPGDATHRSSLSKSRNFVVDNCSRVDLCPKSVLRNGEGELVMELEECDLSQIQEMGWRAPERFRVKAADGMTDLYGNMWKPFDFNPKRKYPLIVYVYPGPQQEGVSHSFSATARYQELAQVGFIVIQVGHRGGTPTRSKAYGSYGYKNMRDYGLEDKKTAIEQLAARHAFIDIERIGIYGHSGGGFMTAAALLKPPYNDFFKVGVSTSGNHDNNIYNNSWAERYHGLTEVKEAVKKTTDASGSGSSSNARRGTETRRGEMRRRGERGGRRDQQQRRRGRRGGEGRVMDDTMRKRIEEMRARRAAGQGRRGARRGNDDLSQGAKKEAGTRSVAKSKGAGAQDKSTQDKKTQKLVTQKSKTAAKTQETKTKFEIKVATNAELAANLKGKLLLIHGELDNNVHPAGTMRLVDALIKANKRFDMLIIPGVAHGYGRASSYATQRTWEYFAEHLLGDRQSGADIFEKTPRR